MYRHTMCTGDQLSSLHIDQYQIDHICSPCGKSESTAMNIPIFKNIHHCSYLLPWNPEFKDLELPGNWIPPQNHTGRTSKL